jgi:hypothetical protein
MDRDGSSNGWKKGNAMVSDQSREVVRKGRQIYEERLKTRLEATNRHDFVAIEPDSGDFFLGKTLSEAIQAARAAYPQRLACALRVGHEATVDLGVLVP